MFVMAACFPQSVAISVIENLEALAGSSTPSSFSSTMAPGVIGGRHLTFVMDIVAFSHIRGSMYLYFVQFVGDG